MGMIAYLVPVSPGQLSAMRGEPDAFAAFLRSDTDKSGRQGLVDLDKAWHGLHYLLTGTAFEGEGPVAQAVMFCVMDVSGSMTEHMKDLAKRFFMLMHVFLTRRYRHVDIVFIRHTDKAMEVDEESFFTSAETGGTLVSSALEEMRRIVAER